MLNASATTGSFDQWQSVWRCCLAPCNSVWKVKVNVPESATLADAEKAARSTLVDDPVRQWTLVDELGGGHPVQLATNDFLEISLQSVSRQGTR